ncbi:MAG: hypothetical protein U0229_12865 [Anaeromyxobacter sp.]
MRTNEPRQATCRSTPAPSPRPSPRGSALLTAVIVIMVVMVLAVGIVRFASREVAGATALKQEQSLVACATAARQMLVSQFHLLGFPANVQALNVELGTTSGNAATRVIGGHYDQPVSTAAEIEQVRITQVTALGDTAFGSAGATPSDISNVISATGGLGGKPYKVIVRCQDGVVQGGRQLEVEFGIRYGL